MKSKVIAFFGTLMLMLMVGCKDEQSKSHVTQTGQRIGNNADSTTVNGPAGHPSNN